MVSLLICGTSAFSMEQQDASLYPVLDHGKVIFNLRSKNGVLPIEAPRALLTQASSSVVFQWMQGHGRRDGNDNTIVILDNINAKAFRMALASLEGRLQFDDADAKTIEVLIDYVDYLKMPSLGTAIAAQAQQNHFICLDGNSVKAMIKLGKKACSMANRAEHQWAKTVVRELGQYIKTVGFEPEKHKILKKFQKEFAKEPLMMNELRSHDLRAVRETVNRSRDNQMRYVFREANAVKGYVKTKLMPTIAQKCDERWLKCREIGADVRVKREHGELIKATLLEEYGKQGLADDYVVKLEPSLLGMKITVTEKEDQETTPTDEK